jgi:hypothetical protein
VQWILVLAAVAGVFLTAWVWHDRNSRLALRVAVGTDHLHGPIGAVGGGPVFSVQTPVVRVRIMNRGGRKVTVECGGWVQPTVRARANHHDFRNVSPATLSRHDDATFDEPLDAFEGVDLHQPQTFHVGLASGEVLYADGISPDRPVSEGRQEPVRARPRRRCRRRA